MLIHTQKNLAIQVRNSRVQTKNVENYTRAICSFQPSLRAKIY
ncbi:MULTISPECIES: hypothetical protein [Photorhabdus]